MLIHVIVTLMLQKNKRPTGARLQKSPGRMTGRLLRLWVWEPLPTKQKAKRIYAAPACDLASGGLFALLAIIWQEELNIRFRRHKKRLFIAKSVDMRYNRHIQ